MLSVLWNYSFTQAQSLAVVSTDELVQDTRSSSATLKHDTVLESVIAGRAAGCGLIMGRLRVLDPSRAMGLFRESWNNGDWNASDAWSLTKAFKFGERKKRRRRRMKRRRKRMHNVERTKAKNNTVNSERWFWGPRVKLKRNKGKK